MDKQTIAQEFITVEEQFRLLEEKVSSHWKSSKLEICLKIVRFWSRLNCLCKVHGLQGYIGSIEESNQKVYHLPLLACLFILPLFLQWKFFQLRSDARKVACVGTVFPLVALTCLYLWILAWVPARWIQPSVTTLDLDIVTNWKQ